MGCSTTIATPILSEATDLSESRLRTARAECQPSANHLEMSLIPSDSWRVGHVGPKACPADGEGPESDKELGALQTSKTAATNTVSRQFEKETNRIGKSECRGWSFVFIAKVNPNAVLSLNDRAENEICSWPQVNSASEDDFLSTASVSNYRSDEFVLFNLARISRAWRIDNWHRRRLRWKAARDGTYHCHRSCCNRNRVSIPTENFSAATSSHAGFHCTADVSNKGFLHGRV